MVFVPAVSGEVNIPICFHPLRFGVGSDRRCLSRLLLWGRRQRPHISAVITVDCHYQLSDWEQLLAISIVLLRL